MKKTLTLLVIALSAAAAYGTEYTTTVGHDKTGNYHGWTANLTDAYAVTTSNPTGNVFADEDFLSLTSVTITTGGTASADIKLAIYALGGDSITSSSSLTHVATSTNALTTSVSSGSTFTFNFSDATITPTANYAFLFYKDTVSDSIIEGMESFTTYASTTHSSNRGVLRFQTGSMSATSTDLLVGVSNSAITLSNGTANATYKTQSVPEPATATLSLLALAGLAARRRRK